MTDTSKAREHAVRTAGDTSHVTIGRDHLKALLAAFANDKATIAEGVEEDSAELDELLAAWRGSLANPATWLQGLRAALGGEEEEGEASEGAKKALQAAWDEYASYMGDPDGKDDTATAFNAAALIIDRFAALSRGWVSLPDREAAK